MRASLVSHHLFYTWICKLNLLSIKGQFPNCSNLWSPPRQLKKTSRNTTFATEGSNLLASGHSPTASRWLRAWIGCSKRFVWWGVQKRWWTHIVLPLQQTKKKAKVTSLYIFHILFANHFLTIPLQKRPHVVWKEKHCKTYLDEMIWWEGWGDFWTSAACPDCTSLGNNIQGAPVYRCLDCFMLDLICQLCCVHRHLVNLFHHVKASSFISLTYACNLIRACAFSCDGTAPFL